MVLQQSLQYCFKFVAQLLFKELKNRIKIPTKQNDKV